MRLSPVGSPGDATPGSAPRYDRGERFRPPPTSCHVTTGWSWVDLGPVTNPYRCLVGAGSPGRIRQECTWLQLHGRAHRPEGRDRKTGRHQREDGGCEEEGGPEAPASASTPATGAAMTMTARLRAQRGVGAGLELIGCEELALAHLVSVAHAHGEAVDALAGCEDRDRGPGLSRP